MGTTGSSWPRRLRYAAGLAVGLTLSAVAVPGLAGTAWTPVAAALTSLPVLACVGLVGLWLSGLVAHTIALAAALPRLGHRRALTLSLTGSAVANVLPLGGAAGVAMNYRMTRSWGFDKQAFAVYTLVTNLWDVLARLSLPIVAVVWLLAAHLSGGALVRLVLPVAVGLGAASLLVVAVLASPRAARQVAAGLERVVLAVVARLPRRWRPSGPLAPGAELLRLRADTADVVRRAWPRLTAGVAAYAVLAAALLAACLSLTHAAVPLAAVVAGFALERVLGLLGLTPGGTGVVEVGMTTLLVTLGGDPVGTVAGVLLYRALSVGLEIPVGGLGILGWLAGRRRAGVAVT